MIPGTNFVLFEAPGGADGHTDHLTCDGSSLRFYTFLQSRCDGDVCVFHPNIDPNVLSLFVSSLRMMVSRK